MTIGQQIENEGESEQKLRSATLYWYGIDSNVVESKGFSCCRVQN